MHEAHFHVTGTNECVCSCIHVRVFACVCVCTYVCVRAGQALSAIFSTGRDAHSRRLRAQFLTRVYDPTDQGELDRLRVERVLLLAHSHTLDKRAASEELDHLFSSGTSSHTHSRYITLKDLEAYDGTLSLVCGWVRAVLSIFVEPASTKLSSLERRYSAALEAEQMAERFSVPRAMCDQLRVLFYSHCATHSHTHSATDAHTHITTAKAELSLQSWVQWTSCTGFLTPSLATVLFRAKLTGLKHAWRFEDFAEFCMIFGTSHSAETKAAFLCVLFQQYTLNCEQRGFTPTVEDCGSSSGSSGGGGSGGVRDDSDSDSEEREREQCSSADTTDQLVPIMRSLIHLLFLPPHATATVTHSSTSSVSPLTPALHAKLQALEQSFLSGHNSGSSSSSGSSSGDESVSEGVSEGVRGATLQAYVGFICDNVHELPGVMLLSMTACCLFGMRPPSPQLEKLYVTELMLWGQAVTSQDAEQPHGPEGAEWALIAASWWDRWRYVSE